MGSDGERDETGGERGCEGRRRGRGERQVRVRERGDQWSATGDKRLGRARTSWGPRHIGDSAAEKVAATENEVSAQGDGERAMNLTGDLRLVDVDDAHAHVRAVLGNDGHGGAADVASAHAADLQTCRGGTI